MIFTLNFNCLCVLFSKHYLLYFTISLSEHRQGSVEKAPRRAAMLPASSGMTQSGSQSQPPTTPPPLVPAHFNTPQPSASHQLLCSLSFLEGRLHQGLPALLRAEQGAHEHRSLPPVSTSHKSNGQKTYLY